METHDKHAARVAEIPWQLWKIYQGISFTQKKVCFDLVCLTIADFVEKYIREGSQKKTTKVWTYVQTVGR